MKTNLLSENVPKRLCRNTNESPGCRQRRFGTVFKCLLLMVILLTTAQNTFATSGREFTSSTLLRDVTWNQEKGRIEFKVMVYDEWSSATDEVLSRAYIYVDGKNQADISNGCRDKEAGKYPNFYLTSFNSTSFFVNAVGRPSSSCTFIQSSTYQEYAATSSYYTTYMGGQVDGNNKHGYAEFFWYPGEISSNRTVTVELRSILIRDYDENSGSGITKTNQSQSKTISIPATPTYTYSAENLGENGKMTFKCEVSGATKIALVTGSSGSTVLQTKTGSNVTFTDVYHTDAVGKFNKGTSSSEDYHFIAYKEVSGGKTIYKFPVSNYLEPPRTGEFTGNLTVTPSTCGDLILEWQVANPPSGSSYVYNLQGFDLEVKRGTGGWTPITGGIPDYKDVKSNVEATTSYTCTYRIPEQDMNKGTINYSFRLKRKFMTWTSSRYKTLFIREVTKSINTDFKELDENKIEIQEGKDKYPRILWNFTTTGTECNDNISLKLKVNNQTTDIPKDSILLMKTESIINPDMSKTYKNYYAYQTTDLNGVESCISQRYELVLQYGSLSAKTYLVNGNYVFEADGKREFRSLLVSKGYYADKINVRWQLRDDYDEFNSFRLQRKAIEEKDTEYVTLAEFVHTRGQLSYNYDDASINAGIYYVYRVEGIYKCLENGGIISSPTDIGFSQPYGSVSGRVTYAGSSAVKDVRINLSAKDALRGNRELDFLPARSNSVLTLPFDTKLFNREGHSFQAWLYFSGTATGEQTMSNNSAVIITRGTDGKLHVKLGNQTVSTVEAVNSGRYVHLSATIQKQSDDYKSYLVSIYLDGELSVSQTVALNAGLTDAGITKLGETFNGQMDDIRVWNKVLTADEIALNYDRILGGKETGLIAYYKCDETDAISDALFDSSASGITFNSFHAIKGSGVNRLDVAAEASHLTIKGVTDEDGNYSIVNSIPYTSEGTLYNISPLFGIHQFDPNKRPLYFSAESRVFNNVDFTDVSSFPVSLTVYYTNSNYPVDSVMVSIDGMPANKDGKALMTDADGKVTVDVPIGAHFITVSKNGHTFVNEGRFPANPLEKYNFQTSPPNGLEFYDSTTVRLMGRVAGGQPETDKPLGFGLSNANIGKATITLQTTNDVYRLNTTTNDSIVADNMIGGKPSTTTFKRSVSGSVIEIETNPETGEFLAVLPPVPYQLTGVKTAGFVDTGASGDAVDFSVDKSIFNMNPLMAQTLEYTDPQTGVKQTFAYNDSVKITRYNDPVILVEDKNAAPGAFGDSVYVHTNTVTGDKTDIPLYTISNGTVNYNLGVPVLTQKKLIYTWNVQAYEEYINNDGSEPVVDHVPLAGKEIDIANALAAERLVVDKDSYEEIADTREASNTVLVLDSVGMSDYQFKVSFPNMAGDHQLAAKLSLDANGKTYSWEKSAILLGQMPSDGNNFVTEGPDYVDIVLHDPPGSNSTASIESGSSYTQTSEHTDIVTSTTTVEATIYIGGKVSSSSGIGFEVETELQSKADILLGTEIEEEWTNNNSRQTTITFNQTISTSGDPNYVGAMADVYIGRSTNMVYGLMNQLALYPTAEKPQEVPASGAIGDYSLFNKTINTAGVKFGTMFYFTQQHLIDHQIPEWISLRNQLIEYWAGTTYPESIDYWGDVKVKYITLLTTEDKNYGRPNTYKVYFKPGIAENEKVDRVSLYNANIENWIARVRENEEYKIKLFNQRGEYERDGGQNAADAWSNKKIFENISYDAGVSVEKSIEVAYDSLEINQDLVTAGAYGGVESGYRVNGIGIGGQLKSNAKRQQGTQTTEGENKTMKFSFTLSEDESVLFAGKDALSVDVYGPISDDMKKLLMENDPLHNQHGYVFRTRAGQTSCPFEPADSTLYYTNSEGKPLLLNYGTFRIEYPELMINGQRDTVSVDNTSAGREATFTLQMSNLSEAGMDVTYQLYPDNATNPDGLILSLDGEALTQARQIRIPYGQTLTKTLKVRQSSLDILDYEGVGIKLGSVCDIDNFSEVFLKLNFIPASSPVALTATSRLANRELLDNAGKITFTISDYDRTFRNFGLLRLQYRNASSENWMNLKEYVNDANLYPVSGDRELIGTRGTIQYDYTFNEITPSDGQYIFRVLAVSKIGTDEIVTASEEIPVVKDIQAPQILGTPQPSNGILVSGGEISLTFNEDIQAGKITDDKFTVTGILNADLRTEPTVGLSFDGAGSYAQTEFPIYTNGSFSIETWMKRPQAKSETLFAYGEGDNYISLGFDASNHVVVTIGSETYASTGTVSVDEVWKYLGLAYNREVNTVSVYVFEGSKSLNLINSQSFTSEPSTHGKLIIGNNAARTAGFTGAVALTEFYNTVRAMSDAFDSKYIVKSGNEPNLIGLWEMEEGEGSTAKDKARARNLIHNTSWYIYPSGRSLAFNGTSDYAGLPSGTFPFISIDDFTWEFWFKAPSQGVATLLSIGSMATVDFNAAHELVLISDGKTQVLDKRNLLDDQWHHFALSVKRSGQAKAVVDGKVTATFTSRELFPGNVGGGEYYLGAKMTRQGTPLSNVYSQYFKGYIDEVRIWQSALTTEMIVFNKNSKLNGNEAGLKAYYPFESYQKRDQTTEVYESLNDAVLGSSNSVGNMTATNTVAVSLKDARTITNVPFTVTASERKIVLNLTEEAYRLEDVTLSITAKDILDMHNNVSAPVSWLAFVNQNTLLWDSEPVNIVMQQGENKTFTGRITNTGAATVSYSIGNIPSWLTVSSSSGSLQPLANRDLAFTVPGSVNIGNYETAVQLTSGNGINELLPVQLKVTGVRPDWSVNSEDFEQSMTATGQILIEGISQEDEDDLLAAFIDDVCVGLASPQYESSYNAYFVYMIIWGNSVDNNKDISFKLWDASTGNIYPMMETSIGGNALQLKFIDGDIEGTPDTPILFNALDIIEQIIAMGKGWNWISSNVNDHTVSLIDQFKANAAGFAAQIKAGNSQYLNNSGGNWGGLLSSITPKEAYLVKSNNVANLKLLGKVVKPAEIPITLAANKWSWIGYTPQFTTTVAEALAGILNPQQGDQVKGQKGYRMMSANGWIGSLSAMEPGRGYMYKSGNTQTVQFNYPSISSSLRSATLRSDDQDKKTIYEADIYRYSGTMTVTASLWSGNTEISEGQYEIAAFNGNECRGSAMLESIDGFEHGFMAFLMVYGEGDEAIRFSIVDHETGMEYNADEYLSFSTDAIYGTPDDLYRISFAATGIDNVGADMLKLYPNPVEKLLYIRYNSEKLDKISIADVSGRIVWLGENFIDESIDVGSFKPGVYLLKVQNDGQTGVYKFIKK